jgi:TolA-binding protein
MAVRPDSQYLCDWQHRVLDATRSSLSKREQVIEARRLAAVYTALPGKAKRSRCKRLTAGALRELATTWHRECQVTRNLETCRLARRLYEEYLSHFSNHRAAYTMAFYLGELLYKLELWPQAAAAYTRVVKMRPKGRRLKEAAYAAVICWQNTLNAEEGRSPPARPSGEIRRALPIPPGEQKMIAAFETYLRVVPSSPERVAILYREGRTYYSHNHYEKAVERFARIATRHSGHELAEFAVKLMLDSLNIMKKEGELRRWVKRFLADKQLARGALGEHLKQIWLEPRWKEAEAHRTAGRHGACGQLFAELANQHQDHPKWSQMLFNAALCFEAAKMIGQAIAIRDTLIRTKPDDRLAQKAMYMIGQNYHALAWYSRAANYYERFARRFSGEPGAPDALQNAIVFHMGRGDYRRAEEAARLFIETYGGRRAHAARAATVHFSLGTIREARDDAEEVLRHYRSYLRRWGDVGGLDRQVQAHVKLGKALWTQACPVRGVDGICVRLLVKRARSKRRISTRTRRRISQRKHCGPETKMSVAAVRRHPAKFRAALTHFKKALALATRFDGASLRALPGEERQRRLQGLRSATAEAHFHLGEAKFEEFVAVRFPEDLDFTSRNQARLARSRRRFSNYLQNKGRMLEAARAVYVEVIKRQVAHFAIAASARVGQLFQSFADALFTAPIPNPNIPRELTGRTQREEFLLAFQDSFCAGLEEYALRLEDKAVYALKTCLTKATDLSWYNEWSGLCERELDQIRPGTNPMAAEIRARPGYVTGRVHRAGVKKRLR